ncbi:MAG TPA: pyruvate ferredoxin oxidoreductase, partial [Firmicutes bacterium]|nr:pyruvate ferredoxin oxidoreductase [Bacillota bacterium]
GALFLPDYYFEARRQIADAMGRAAPVIEQVGEEYARLTGRRYGLFEAHRLEDAEVAVVAINSAAGTARAVADSLRKQGVRAGVLKIRVFRPWPWREIAQALASAKAVAVMDRADGLCALGGPLYTEVRSALYDSSSRPALVNYIYGLGGRDVGLEDIEGIFRDLLHIKDEGGVAQPVTYLGVRE